MSGPAAGVDLRVAPAPTSADVRTRFRRQGRRDQKDPAAPRPSRARIGPLQRGRWAAKLAANVARDRRTDALLTGLGWRVLRFWEHEDPDAVADAISAELARPPAAAPREARSPASGAAAQPVTFSASVSQPASSSM